MTTNRWSRHRSAFAAFIGLGLLPLAAAPWSMAVTRTEVIPPDQVMPDEGGFEAPLPVGVQPELTLTVSPPQCDGFECQVNYHLSFDNFGLAGLSDLTFYHRINNLAAEVYLIGPVEVPAPDENPTENGDVAPDDVETEDVETDYPAYFPPPDSSLVIPEEYFGFEEPTIEIADIDEPDNPEPSDEEPDIENVDDDSDDDDSDNDILDNDVLDNDDTDHDDSDDSDLNIDDVDNDDDSDSDDESDDDDSDSKDESDNDESGEEPEIKLPILVMGPIYPISFELVDNEDWAEWIYILPNLPASQASQYEIDIQVTVPMQSEEWLLGSQFLLNATELAEGLTAEDFTIIPSDLPSVQILEIAGYRRLPDGEPDLDQPIELETEQADFAFADVLWRYTIVNNGGVPLYNLAVTNETTRNGEPSSAAAELVPEGESVLLPGETGYWWNR